LQQRVPGYVVDSGAASPHAASGLRSPWFAVSCCPTNLSRMLASLAGYVATVDEGGLQLQQLAACTVRATLPDGRAVGLRVDTGYPWSGAVTVRVEEATGGPWRLALRVPAWADGAELADGDLRRRVGPGYAVLERDWRPGDQLRLDLPVAPRWTRPDPRVDAVRGCVAAERGPLVYCVESVDQGPDARLDEVAVDATAPLADQGTDDALGGAVTLRCDARPLLVGERGGPDGAMPLTLVPYHLWGNRGAAAMRVWLPERSPGERVAG
jgi:uncharacterized protein